VQEAEEDEEMEEAIVAAGAEELQRALEGLEKALREASPKHRSAPCGASLKP